jgi:hypothetical protein
MSTIKKGSLYRKTKGGGKKKLLNIMEELLGVDHITFATREQLEDRQKALIVRNKYAEQRTQERTAHEKKQLDKREQRKQERTERGDKAEADANESDDSDDPDVTSGTSGQQQSKKSKFTSIGNIDPHDQDNIQKILDQLNEILRLPEFKLYNEIDAKENSVIIQTFTTKDGDEKVDSNPIVVHVDPLEDLENLVAKND